MIAHGRASLVTPPKSATVAIRPFQCALASTIALGIARYTIVVADEPTGDLDAKSAEEILTLLAELNQRFKKTIVMVTHDSRAERFIDIIFRLDKGVFVGEENNLVTGGKR